VAGFFPNSFFLVPVGGGGDDGDGLANGDVLGERGLPRFAAENGEKVSGR